MKARALTPAQEDQILADDEARKSLGIKQLCEKYKVCETTLRDAIKRAKRRKTTEVVIGSDGR